MQVPTASAARPESGSEAAHDQPMEAWKTTWAWAKNRAPQAELQCCLLWDDGPRLAHNENTRKVADPRGRAPNGEACESSRWGVVVKTSACLASVLSSWSGLAQKGLSGA